MPPPLSPPPLSQSRGKTYRSRQLLDFFARRIAESDAANIKRLTLHHIDDDSLGVSREVYATARAEKDARAAFASAIKRALSRDAVVIADGMNYIKGFRYQMYCEAKALSTPSCVVHVGTPAATCRDLHRSDDDDDDDDDNNNKNNPPRAYAPDVFDNLLFRYEEPNGMNRWDAPLFTVAFDDETPPCDAIWDAVVGGPDGTAKRVRPNAATVLKPAAEQGYLYELDRATSEVIALITAWQQHHPGEGGGEVAVPGAEAALVLPINTPSLPQLQRLRRQFIGLNRQHALEKGRIRDLFVDYLNDAFQS